MNKVTLPKDVAQSITLLREQGWSNVRIACALNDGHAIEGSSVGKLRKFAYVDGDNEDVLLSALVNGYEIECTPEEKLREYYEGLVEVCNDTLNDNLTRDLAAYESAGVFKTLDILGITIEGINA